MNITLGELGEPLPIISPLLLDLKKKKERNVCFSTRNSFRSIINIML